MVVVPNNIEYNNLVRIVQELSRKVDELERRTSFNAEGWTGGVTNLTVDRAYDADSTTLAELADVLGTLIQDLLEAEVLT
jgi:hypothetical protein